MQPTFPTCYWFSAPKARHLKAWANGPGRRYQSILKRWKCRNKNRGRDESQLSLGQRLLFRTFSARGSSLRVYLACWPRLLPVAPLALRNV